MSDSTPPPTQSTQFDAAHLAAAKRVVLLTTFLDILGFGIIIPQLGIYAAQYGADPSAIGWLMSSYSLMQFLFAPFWGRLSDRLGRRPLLIWSIFGTALGYVIFAYADSLWLLFASRIISGITGANIAIAQAYLSDVTPAQDRAKTYGIFGAIFGVGFAIGPLIGAQLTHLPGHWGGNFGLGWFTAALSFLNFALALRSLPETLTPEARAANAERHSAQRTAGPINVHGFQRALTLPNLRLLIILSFVQVVAFATLQGTYTVFLIAKYVRPEVQARIRANPQEAIKEAQSRLAEKAQPTTVAATEGAPESATPSVMPYAAALGGDFNPTDLPTPPDGLTWRRIEQLLVQPAAAHLVNWIFTTIGMLALIVQGGMVGPLKKRFGEVNLIIIGTALLAFSLAIIPLPRQFGWQFFSAGLTAFGNSIAAPVLTALVSLLAPEAERGEIIGVFQSTQSLGRIIGPLIGGWLFTKISLAAPYYAGAAIMFVAFLISLKLRSLEFQLPHGVTESAPEGAATEA